MERFMILSFVSVAMVPGMAALIGWMVKAPPAVETRKRD